MPTTVVMLFDHNENIIGYDPYSYYPNKLLWQADSLQVQADPSSTNLILQRNLASQSRNLGDGVLYTEWSQEHSRDSQELL